VSEPDTTDNTARLLSTVQSGQTVRLVRIDAGHGLKSRLIAMGLVPNAQITVVRQAERGPIVIIVKDTKMMLGRGMAQKIVVQ